MSYGQVRLTFGQGLSSVVLLMGKQSAWDEYGKAGIPQPYRLLRQPKANKWQLTLKKMLSKKSSFAC